MPKHDIGNLRRPDKHYAYRLIDALEPSARADVGASRDTGTIANVLLVAKWISDILNP